MVVEQSTNKPADGGGKVSWMLPIIAAVVLVLLFYPPLRQMLVRHNIEWLRILLFAWALSTILTPLAIRLSFKLGWLDIPSGRKAHLAPTPLLGGLAIIATFGISLLVNFHYSLPMKGVGLAGLLIWLVGVIDDRWAIPAKLKLLAQLIAAGILILFGVHVTFMPPTLWGNIVEIIITVLWVVGITNAVNFLDGMDGLAVGMASIISFFLAIVAVQTGQFYFTIVALALLGACLGFLPNNFRWRGNARIFLGDNGATFLGFTLAAAVIMGDWAEENLGDIAVPFLLMAVPIFDMTLTTVIRFATGRVRTLGEWLAYTGRDHFHHRLASLGIGRKTSVLVIWSITFFLGISAVVLKETHGIYVVLVLAQAALLFAIITFFMIFVRSHQIRLIIDTIRHDNRGAETDEQTLDRILTSSDRPTSPEDSTPSV